jgi:hypothetical protein
MLPTARHRATSILRNTNQATSILMHALSQLFRHPPPTPSPTWKPQWENRSGSRMPRALGVGNKCPNERGKFSAITNRYRLSSVVCFQNASYFSIRVANKNGGPPHRCDPVIFAWDDQSLQLGL